MGRCLRTIKRPSGVGEMLSRRTRREKSVDNDLGCLEGKPPPGDRCEWPFWDCSILSGGPIDASQTYDPDADNLTFKWPQYREPNATQTYRRYEVSDLSTKPLEDGRRVEVSIAPSEKSCVIVREQVLTEKGLFLYLILGVTNANSPPMTSYRRVIIQPINRQYSSRGTGKDFDGW